MGGKVCHNFLFALFSILVFLSEYEHDAESVTTTATSTKCTDEIRQNKCSLPDCRCSGPDIPGGLTRSQVPQMVFLTFDDAVNDHNFDLYQEIFLLPQRKNPDGHPITLTFFVSHEYTVYPMVHTLWRHGHEIALHSITHSHPVEYWKDGNESMWHQEIVDQRQQMSSFAKIPATDIQGIRSPFLQGGGDTMYKVLHSSGFTWDCSRPSDGDPLLWPYTNDFASTQACDLDPCPKNRYPGFWTVPMTRLTGKNGRTCPMVDSCYPMPTTANDTFHLLLTNFRNHHDGNRAPFGIFAHSGWLIGNAEALERKQGYVKFLDYLASLNDTYVVGISKALEWIKSPTKLDELKNFTPFHVDLKPDTCKNTSTCTYISFGTEKWFNSCVAECPKIYPWLGNPIGY